MNSIVNLATTLNGVLNLLAKNYVSVNRLNETGKFGKMDNFQGQDSKNDNHIHDSAVSLP